MSGNRPPAGRLTYSAIVDRPAVTLPDGLRMLVWIIVNVEHWRSDHRMPRTVLPPPMGQPLMPDLPNWAWHEYGMRVGFWRLRQALADRGLKATLALNADVVNVYPRVAEAALTDGWEFMGHGFVQRPMHAVDDLPADIENAMETIGRFAGRRPRGWESPGLTETFETADLLAAAGVDYVADWVIDDQPATIETAYGPLATIPYTVETNDITLMALQQHRSDELYRRGRDQFDRLWVESAEIPRVMSISLHPYITGVPHRIGYLEKLLDHIAAHRDVRVITGEAVIDTWRAAGALPAARVD